MTFRPTENDFSDKYFRPKNQRSISTAFDGPITTSLIIKSISKSKRNKRNKRKRIYKRDNYECVYCGSGEGLTLDHKVPKSKGGSNEDSNLQTCCGDCNGLKGNTYPFHI